MAQSCHGDHRQVIGIENKVIDGDDGIGLDDVFNADVVILQGGQEFVVVAHIGLRHHPLLVRERCQSGRAGARS